MGVRKSRTKKLMIKKLNRVSKRGENRTVASFLLHEHPLNVELLSGISLDSFLDRI